MLACQLAMLLARLARLRFRSEPRPPVAAIATAAVLASAGGCAWTLWQPHQQCCCGADTTASKASAAGSSAVDVLIVGGGVVGLAVARECAVRGRSVMLVEREPWLAAGASSGNSGIGCTGYDAPVGSLERRLLRRAVQLHPHLYRSFGLSYDHVRKCGSLIVAWNERELSKLPAVLSENREAGDTDACLLTQQELRELEPSLSHQALGAVLCPREAIVEPWLVPQGYAESARLHGAQLLTATSVVSTACRASMDGSGCWWEAKLISHPQQQQHNTQMVSPGRSRDGALLVPSPASLPLPSVAPTATTVRARVVINCAGLFGDAVEQMRLWPTTQPPLAQPLVAEAASPAGTSAHRDGAAQISRQEQSTAAEESAIVGLPWQEGTPFHVTPRKGQFLVLKPKPATSLNKTTNAPVELQQLLPQFIIEPVASQFTKGIIAFTSIYGNLVIGPTATPQSAREDRSTDAATLTALLQHGVRALKGLSDCADAQRVLETRAANNADAATAAHADASSADERLLKHYEIVGSYSGLRPATEYRDYQIEAHASHGGRGGWITVAGIRSTGLTASPAIAEYVGDLMEKLLPMAHAGQAEVNYEDEKQQENETLQLAPDGLVGVTAAASRPLSLRFSQRNGNMAQTQVQHNSKIPTL
eukprot:COSAG05_NODE_3079_length_2340_cov_1.724230_1_plen_648_part_01